MALEKKHITFILPAMAGALAVLLLAVILFFSHGRVEAKGFCNFCHTQYYDPMEYSFNEKVGMEKPRGVLTGCAECHPQPYREFKESVHFETDKEERRPGCSNCHEPHSVFKWFKYMFYYPAEWHRVRESIHDNTLWEEEVRPDLAAKARLSFVRNRSQLCKDCHLPNNFREDIKAHKKELEGGIEGVICVKCHYNLVHAEVDWDDKDEMLKSAL